MDNLIVLKREDLDAAIHKAVEAVLEWRSPNESVPEVLTVDEAVDYMANRGLIISRSSIYKNTMTGTIPFLRWGGRKIVFRTEELDKWIEGRLYRNENSDEMTKTIAAAARKKDTIA